ncbi:MAG: DUF2064 domain-containing protein [Caulobacteraceae bacterium]
MIFARRPAFGVGKRRLAAGAGELAALRFQRWATFDLIRRLRGSGRWRVWVAITPDRPAAWVRGAEALPQGSGDLGRRLARVMRALPPGPAVVIGTDAPGIAARDIADAFRALGAHDAVLGPAPDGGFWLIGLRRRPRAPLPFDDVRWSTAQALADTRANLAGRRVALLRTLEDIDDLASYRRAAGLYRGVAALGRRRSSCADGG